jgi:tetratricopeptide (TPR) repeat protein
MGPAAVLLLMWPLQTLQPSSAAEWKAAGIAEVGANKLDAAVTAFGKACELDPKDEDACYFLARTLSSLDQWEKARDPFEKALRAASPAKLARVHRAIALNFVALGDTVNAERHFRQAIARNPGPEVLREDPRVDYGAFLFRHGRLNEALPLLQQAVRVAPRSARAHTELGRVVLHLGKAEAATASLEKAVNLDPRSSAARLLLGRAYLQSGRVEEGQKQLQLARDAGASTVK